MDFTVGTPAPIERLPPKQRELVLGYYQARDSLPAGKRWRRGYSTESTTEYEGFRLEQAAQSVGLTRGKTLCALLAELSGDLMAEVAWNLRTWAEARVASRADWVKLWRGE